MILVEITPGLAFVRLDNVHQLFDILLNNKVTAVATVYIDEEINDIMCLKLIKVNE